MEDRFAKAEALIKTEEKGRKDAENRNQRLEDDKNNLLRELEEIKNSATDFGAKITKLNAAKQELAKQLDV